jgi:hypothetical protein
MGLLRKFFGSNVVGPCRSESDHAKNRSKQLEISPQTVAVLREHGVTDEKVLPLEFFFYTNADEKAATLSVELSALGYSASHGRSASAKNEYVINGWTNPVRMDENSVLEWTAQMCDMGAKYDCEFDGWGTDPTKAQ